MAIRFAKQAGNWSSASTWDGGLTVPTTGDEVYLNGYNIAFDQDATVGFIANSITPVGVPQSFIPNMLSNTSPNTVGQAFATQNNIDAWKVFRRSINTFSPSGDGWQGATNSGQIGYQFNTPKNIQRYSWYNNQGANNRPRDWTFQGSNDGVTWVTLHTVTTAPNQATYISPNIANPASYTYYRINVTACQTNTTLIINALDMSETTDVSNGYQSGGTATISTSRTVNADLYHNTGTLITISATSPSVVNINGNMPGTVATSNHTGINMTGNSTLNYVGDVIAATTIQALGQQSGVVGINVSTGGTLNVTGNVAGGRNGHSNFGQGATIGIRTGASSIVNIVGNVSSGLGTYSNVGVQNTQNATVNVTGNIENGAGLGGPSVFNTLNLGFYLGTGASLCSVIGNVTANAGGHGVYASSNPVKITGNLTNSSSGLMAFTGPILFLEQPTQWQFRKTDLSTITLYTPGVATGFPATNNVRTGITYGPTNNLTGTCAVPPANAVSVGVPVDNTVGTANVDTNALAIALTASLSASLPTPIATSLDASLSASLPTPISASLQASLPTPIATALDTSLSASLPAAIAPLLWDEDVANITTPNSIGERLKNCATVATTGAQISSFNP